jgi:hypothetical protein
MRINLGGGIWLALCCLGCAALSTEDEPPGFMPVVGASGSAGSSTQPPVEVDLGAACDETRSVDPGGETYWFVIRRC